MIEINKRDSELLVKFDYLPEHVSKIKTLRPARWNSKEKVWVIPNSTEMLEILKKLFSSEQINILFENVSSMKRLLQSIRIS